MGGREREDRWEGECVYRERSVGREGNAWLITYNSLTFTNTFQNGGHKHNNLPYSSHSVTTTNNKHPFTCESASVLTLNFWSISV